MGKYTSCTMVEPKSKKTCTGNSDKKEVLSKPIQKKERQTKNSLASHNRKYPNHRVPTPYVRTWK